MSLWHEITDKDDVDYDPNFDSIDIAVSKDQFGCNYITISVDLIINALKNVYIINKKDERS